MVKHVCPVCEHVYALRAEFTVQLPEGPQSIEAWACPECPYVFVAVDRLAQVFEAMTTAVGAAAPVLTTTFQDQPEESRIQPALR